MGKRKSKTGKQKQANARKKNGKKNSWGGIAASKGMNSKFQQHAKSSSAVSINMSNKKFDNAANGKKITEASLRLKLNAKTKKIFLATPAKAAEAPSGKNKSSSKVDEQAEFRSQMASLQERQMAAQQQKKPSKKDGALSFGFQEASFSLQKTPQQMLQETTRKMETMRGVGQQGIGSFSSTPIRTNQSWAVAAKEPSSPLAHKNPFETLVTSDWDEDDNNEWTQVGERKQESAASGLFSMAPPTFSLLPRITPTPATSPYPKCGEDEDEVDPDL
ncbi:MAG: hypothetical protein SGBAC_004952 [Bacillariaceae sp.]